MITSELVPSPQSLCPNFVVLRFPDTARPFSYEDYFEFRYVLSDTRTVKGVSPQFHLIRSLRSESSLPLQSLLRDQPQESPLVSLAPEPCCKCVELNVVKNQLEAALETKRLLTSELKDTNDRLDHLSNVYEVNMKESRNLHSEMRKKDDQIKSLEEINETQVEAITNFTKTGLEKQKTIEELNEKIKGINLERDNLFAQLSCFDDKRMSPDVKEEYEARLAVLEAEKSRLGLEVADKEAWVSSLGTELARMSDESSKALREKEESDKKAEELTQELDLLRADMSRLNTELLDTKDELAAAEARCASFESMEETTTGRLRHMEQRLEQCNAEIEALEKLNATHVEKLTDLVQEKDNMKEEHVLLTRRHNALENEVEGHRIQAMQLQLKKQECEDEVQQLRAALKKQCTAQPAQPEVPRASAEIHDADVLMKYLPSLTQALIGISNTETSPNTQKVIKELRDMIRFLLTAHEKMKTEIHRLRNK